MTRDQIRAALETLTRDQLGWTRPLPEGHLDASLDSVDRLALVVAVEDAFHITFEPDDEARVHTLDELIDFIAERHAG